MGRKSMERGESAGGGGILRRGLAGVFLLALLPLQLYGEPVAFLGDAAGVEGLSGEEGAAWEWVEGRHGADYVAFAEVASNPGLLGGYDVLWWHYDGATALPSSAATVAGAVEGFVADGGGLLLSGFAPQYVLNLGLEGSAPSLVVRDATTSGEWGFTKREPDHPVFDGLTTNPFLIVSAGLSVDNNICWWSPPASFGGAWLADTEWNGNLVVLGEYAHGSGKVLVVGTGAFVWGHEGTNLHRANLERLASNMIDHLGSEETPTPTPTSTPAPTPPPAAGDDIVINDFEAATWGDWEVTGTAWGPRPAAGAVGNQMEVTGYLGGRLANSFHGGDGAVGTVTSPPFTIERDFIRFLIGGGTYRGEGTNPAATRINLLIDGRVVRHAAGNGRFERLDWLQWDVSGLRGRTARVELVDTATGAWGHLNVDHIVMTDTPLPESRLLDRRYLNFPVKLDAPERVVDVMIDGLAMEDFRINLGSASDHDFHTFIDMGAQRGRRVIVRVDAVNRTDFANFPLTAEPAADTPIYQEALRPRYHFTARRGFINDPNGMVHHNGEYHLGFQHNPHQLAVGNQVWGHAVSRDLVHWRERGTAIGGDALGQAWSGSSVVDVENTAGFGAGAIVSFYTSAAGYGNNNIMSAGQDFTQSLAYSPDGNRTFIKYEGNPVLPNRPPGDNRDPFVFWHGEGARWVMLLWMRADPSTFEFFSSTDMVNWEPTSTFVFPGVIEVPMMLRLPLDGDPGNMKWILWAGDGHYFTGEFDGGAFNPESGPHWMSGGSDRNVMFAASQVFANQPDGRTILVANDNSVRDFPGMPFNKILTFPVELSLRTAPGGTPWLYANPVEEIAKLRRSSLEWSNVPLGGGNALAGVSGEAYEIDATFRWGNATEIRFTLGDTVVAYDTVNRRLRCTPPGGRTISRPLDDFSARGDWLRLHILVDIGSVEVFGNDGHRYLTLGVPAVAGERPISLSASGTGAVLESMELHHLGSIWETGGDESWMVY